MARIGFNPSFLAQQQAQQVALGNVLSGTGFGGDYGTALLGSLGDGKSKNLQVNFLETVLSLRCPTNLLSKLIYTRYL
jgi:hypothetical protein